MEMKKLSGAGIALFLSVFVFSGIALCESMSTEEIQKEQKAMKELMETMQNRINQLEGELNKKGQEIAEIKKAPTKAEGGVLAEIEDRLSFSGDFRLRYENTSNQDDVTSRNREVLRFRGDLTYRVNNVLTAGVRLATGSADDPNTTDVTASNFVDDFDVNLTRLYLSLKQGPYFLTAGKFANPFLRTDILWDGDVNPMGVAGSYTFSQCKHVTPKLTGIYFIIDEQSSSDLDSSMFGGQASVKIANLEDWSFTFAGAYYDYHIATLVNADAGDIGSNTLNLAGTKYLSDFDIFDAIAIVEYRGLGKRLPMRLVGDYVKNYGAVGDEDQGYSVDLFVGKKSKKGDYRFRYGYSQVERDAVLAAFSHDNTTIQTNYKEHTISADYVVWKNVILNATWYLYRRDELGTTPTTDSDKYVSRLRLNAVVKF